MSSTQGSTLRGSPIEAAVAVLVVLNRLARRARRQEAYDGADPIVASPVGRGVLLPALAPTSRRRCREAMTPVHRPPESHQAFGGAQVRASSWSAAVFLAVLMACSGGSSEAAPVQAPAPQQGSGQVSGAISATAAQASVPAPRAPGCRTRARRRVRERW
jgi:hypothetical protein